MFATACAAWAGSINFSGTFATDDQVQLFRYTVQVTGNVTVSTTSFDGTPTGGFAPVLTVFDSTGLFIFDNTNATTNDNASLTWFSDADELFIVALTEYPNFSSGPAGNLSDGFTMADTGNFTANPPFNNYLPGGFYNVGCPDPSTCQSTGNWAVTFTAADPDGLHAYQVPEPGASSLAAAGLALLLGCRYFLRRSFAKGLEG
jgi:hypothetical protein